MTVAATLRLRVGQALTDYLKRGRPLADLDDQALRRRYVLAHRAWSRHPYHGDVIRQLNDASSEFMARRQPAPVALVAADLALFAALAGKDEATLDNEPAVMIAVLLEPPLCAAVLYAPFLLSLLIPADDRYGDEWLRQTVARQQAAASPRITSGEAA